MDIAGIVLLGVLQLTALIVALVQGARSLRIISGVQNGGRVFGIIAVTLAFAALIMFASWSQAIQQQSFKPMLYLGLLSFLLSLKSYQLFVKWGNNADFEVRYHSDS